MGGRGCQYASIGGTTSPTDPRNKNAPFFSLALSPDTFHAAILIVPSSGFSNGARGSGTVRLMGRELSSGTTGVDTFLAARFFLGGLASSTSDPSCSVSGESAASPAAGARGEVAVSSSSFDFDAAALRFGAIAGERKVWKRARRGVGERRPARKHGRRKRKMSEVGAGGRGGGEERENGELDCWKASQRTVRRADTS